MAEYREEEVVRTEPMSHVNVKRDTARVRRRSWWGTTSESPVVYTAYYDSTLYQFVRVMWYLLGLLEGLMAIRFILALLAANPNNGFASLIYAITGPLVAPFRTLFATPSFEGSVFELYTLIAMLVYFLAWWAIVRLVEVIASHPSVD